MSTPTITPPPVPPEHHDNPGQPYVPFVSPPIQPSPQGKLPPVWARWLIAGVAGFFALGIIGAVAGHSSTPATSAPATPVATAPAAPTSALAVVQSDGYNYANQDIAVPAVQVDMGVVSMADGINTNGDVEGVWVLTPSTDANVFEAGVLPYMQNGAPDTTGSVDGNVVRVITPAEDNPSL